MNKFDIRVLMAGHGDCIWIEYGNPSAPSRVLIDGGTAGTFNRLKPLLEAVQDGESYTHELLVVTHVDADHIAGCIPVLSNSLLAKQFKEVWFNGRQHLEMAPGLEVMGAAQGETLTSAITSNRISWNASFNGQSVALNGDGQVRQVLLEGGAVITILSPGQTQLSEMAKAWDDEIRKAGLKKGTKAEEPERKKGLERLGLLDVNRLADTVFDEDNAPANGSSIAFLMEFQGKRALFAADAHPSVLLRSLKQLNGGAKFEIDLFKIPHHGSKYNLTRELLEHVPSKKYALSTNGAYFKHPDVEAVAKIIKYGPKGASLVFNCKSEFNDMWDSIALMGQWGYSIQYGDEQSGIEMSLL